MLIFKHIDKRNLTKLLGQNINKFCCASAISALFLSLAACATSSHHGEAGGYRIDSKVVKTTERIITFPSISSGLEKYQLSNISKYSAYGYGDWTFGSALTLDPRTESTTSKAGIMPDGYDSASVTQRLKLLNFFAMTDVHMTDKESPSQILYLQQLYYPNGLGSRGNYPWGYQTSVYSPTMLYSTQVLDAAVQTVNALHKQNPIDFGIFLGDVVNSTQYNELRWFIDILDGKVITPSSGAHAGAESIDYQKPFKATGLDKSIPWYEVIGNHDHFWIGSLPVTDYLRASYITSEVLAAGDVLLSTANISKPLYYMGVLDGSTPYGDLIDAGPVADFSTPPKVVPDQDRRSLSQVEWMNEFFYTASSPTGHGFSEANVRGKFACYSFVPKSDIPIKVIALDDTRSDTDGYTDIHGHGFLDATRYAWLKQELADGDAAGQLMIIAAHIPIGVQPANSYMEWWTNAQNAVTISDLIAELQSHPNLLMWLAGHRHFNTVKAFASTDSAHPENGFWQVETASLKDWPQQFRTFEIYLNSDYTISIDTINVDPAAAEGTPAWVSRKYAVAAQQIVGNNLSPNFANADPNLPVNAPDPSIKDMPTCSYNARLYKKLSPAMELKLKALFPVK